MSSRRQLDDRMVDALAALAAEAEPPPMSAAARDAQIAAAMREAARAPVGRAPAGWARAGYALSAAAAVFFGLFAVREWTREPSPVRTAQEMVLPTGDRVLTSPSASLRFADLTAETRDVELFHGEALFDVRPLAQGQSFRVRAAELEVEVTGTVFSVELTEDDALVRVYEGHVRVRSRDTVLASLRAGERYSARHGAGIGVDDAALAADGRRAAQRRAAAPSSPGSPQPVPQDVPALNVPALNVPAPVESPPIALPEGSLPERAIPERAIPERDGEGASLPAARRSEASTAQRSESGHLSVPPRERSGDPRETRETVAEREEEVEDEPSIGTAEVVALLGARRFADALEASRRGASRSGEPRFRIFEAQALEGLGRAEDAADTLDAIAQDTSGGVRAEAAYRAASLRWRALHDPRGTVRSLASTSFDGTAFEERALGLRALALEALGDRAEASQAAERYLERYPSGGLADDLREALAR
ncbi:MAG: FecR domain-containing protein [Deltaproteobacteria bacterium]